MTLTAALLLIISAFIHAFWNLKSKSGKPVLAFFLFANTCGVLFMAPVGLYFMAGRPDIPGSVWGLVFLTGLFQAGYFSFLAQAYQAGDLSIVYPLVRSSPVIVVTAASVLLGQGGEIGPWCVIGILVVVAGCFILPMSRFNDFKIKNYINYAGLSAMVAATCSAGYSMVDDAALDILRRTDGLSLGSVEVTLLYAFWEGVFTVFWLGAALLAVEMKKRFQTRIAQRHPVREEIGPMVGDSREKGAAHEFARMIKPAVITGVSIYVTYSLVLISMAYADNVSYVVAFRQLSIPIGALLGIWLLKEPAYKPKFLGVTTIFIGLVLVGLG